MEKKTIKTTSAISLKTFNNQILFTLKDFSGLFVGYKKNYQKLGEYDNTTGTLEKISNNKKLLPLLSGTFSAVALAGFLYSGAYTLEDIKEYYKLCKKLNIKYYDIMKDEKENKALYNLEAKRKRKEEEGAKCQN